MNLNNVSAIALSVSPEHMVEKVSEVQALRFYVQRLEMTPDSKVKIIAKLLEPSEPMQRLEEVDFEDLRQRIRVFEDSKKNRRLDPYCW